MAGTPQSEIITMLSETSTAHGIPWSFISLQRRHDPKGSKCSGQTSKNG